MARFWDAWKTFKPLKYATILYYDRELDLLVPEVKTFLEIGCTESSISFWKAVYPKSVVIGCDVGELLKAKELGIPFIIGNITKEETLESLYKSGPYDIVCEDASHVPETQILVFKKLWPITTLYIIEDILGSGEEIYNILKPWIEKQGGWCLIRKEYANDPDIIGSQLQNQGFLYAMHQKPDLPLTEDTVYEVGGKNDSII